jgi:hypothetical protein
MSRISSALPVIVGVRSFSNYESEKQKRAVRPFFRIINVPVPGANLGLARRPDLTTPVHWCRLATYW